MSGRFLQRIREAVPARSSFLGAVARMIRAANGVAHFAGIGGWVDDHRMARTTITQITDDIDGSKDARELSFAFNGTEYTIDLGKKNRTAFEKALQPYIDAGTRVAKRSSSTRRPSSASTRKDFSAIREWAKSQGLEVSERGRIPRAIVEQYEAAN